MGSGKSLFSSFLKKKGIPIYSSDERCKILMNQIQIIKINILKIFGNNSYQNEKINKNYLSNIIFQNDKAYKLISNIVHPWIKIDFRKWMFLQTKNSYLVKESSLLFERGNYKECHIIINISSSLQNSLERVMNRDYLNEIQIFNRLKYQIPNKIKNQKSNIIIDNNSSIDSLKQQSYKIHNKIIQKIKKYG